MTFAKIRHYTGLSQWDFAKKYNIPLDTVFAWETDEPDLHEDCPVYVLELLDRAVKQDFAKAISGVNNNAPYILGNPKITNRDKTRFQNIVRTICGLYFLDETRDAVEELNKAFEQADNKTNFDIVFKSTQIGLENIEYSFDRFREFYTATIHAGTRKTETEIILYWNDSIDKLLSFIKEHSVVVYQFVKEF